MERTRIDYPLTVGTWDRCEVAAIQELLCSGNYTMGDKVAEFEKEFARAFDSKYAVMVNSGSSANLLAVAALFYTKHQPLKPGDEVIVPAVSWATTYFPLQQYGLKLRFVDVDPNTLNIDPSAVEKAITPATKAIFAVNLLGNPCDYQELQRICDKHELCLLEDNCESMGARYQNKHCGTFGRLSTFSCYYSHHICTIEGGVILTEEEELYHILLALRSHGWTRHLPTQNHLENKSGNAFQDSFRFLLPGYNVRPTDLSGAVGLTQLDKLPALIEGRLHNAMYFQEIMRDYPGIRIQTPCGESSWFGFAVILEQPYSGRRDEIAEYLQRCGIDCRPIVAGNFVNHPAVEHLDYSVYGELKHAEELDKQGFFIGNQHLDLREELDFFKECLDKVLPLKKP